MRRQAPRRSTNRRQVNVGIGTTSDSPADKTKSTQSADALPDAERTKLPPCISTPRRASVHEFLFPVKNKSKPEKHTGDSSIEGAANRSIPALSRSSHSRSDNDDSEFTENYHSQTRRPILSLAFVLPLILAYEVGAMFLGSDALRSGIDLWLDRILVTVGAGHLVILPMATTAALLVLHHYKEDQWRFQGTTLWGMLVESTGLGLILFWVASAYYQVASQCEVDSSLVLPMMVDNPRWSAATIVSLGSGIYEELVFRLLLLVPAIYVLKTWLSDKRVATAAAMIGVSLLFTALHYTFFNPAGHQLDVSSFLFRFAVSMIFCILFILRGFGIAVGTHVTYDVLTQM